jgi:type I restriction enzyme S subunit
MEVTQGYKQTEIGVIPKDWTVIPMAELFTFQNGVNADKAAYGKGIPFINVLEVITHSTLTEASIPGRISLPPQTSCTFRVQTGDVLFNRTSETQEEVGLASVYMDNSEVVFGGFVIRARPRNSSLDPRFSSYALRSRLIRQQIVSRGQGAVRANIGQQDLSKVQVFVPPLPEQEAIAEVLSNADALIECLEQLIAKKRLLKKGVMQELLTGKRRLREFADATTGYKQTEVGVIPEDWSVASMGELFTFQNGVNAGKAAYGKGTPFINVLEVITYPMLVEAKIPGRISLPPQAISTFRVQTGDVLFNRTSETQEEVGLASVYKDSREVVFGGFVIRARPQDSSLDPLFSSYALRSPAIRRQIISRGQGVVRANIGQQELSKVQVFVPPFHEQEAIAAILSSMDDEIALLEAQLAKYRQLKQGLMQKLLIGRIRLV